MKFESNAAPIGVFDSGLGGLTVVRKIWEMLPYESILFVADQAHVPYGGRDLKEVCGFACGISESLYARGCKAVVMACNISSATALSVMRSEHPDRPTLGVIEPGARAACERTRNGRVGIMATEGTVRTGAYPDAILRQAPDIEVFQVACPDFVPLVEAGNVFGEAALLAARTYLAPLLAADVDTIVLGCTHYPFLLPALSSLSPHIVFIDPAEHTVRDLSEELKRNDILAPKAKDTHSETVLTTTGAIDVLHAQMRIFLPESRIQTPVATAHWFPRGLVLP